MGTTMTATSELEKQPYQNQTAGWISVVKLDPLGQQKGTPVEPGGKVWLTEEEAKLTARAPKLAQDSPFQPKMFDFYDENGQIVRQEMTPLVLITDERDIPTDDRPIPTEVVAPTPGLQSAPPINVPTVMTQPSIPPETPPQEDGSWTENPSRSEAPQSGSLGGSDGSRPVPPAGDPLAKGPRAPSPAATSPVQPATPAAAPEETAAVLDSGEETGAADTPVGDAPEGEYAAHEEVGSPDAPTATATEDR